jgi:hypothetical protein
MTTSYQPGDDVVVTFDGVEHAGEVERVENGFIRCRISIETVSDYGNITPRLAPQSTVCVRRDHVRPAQMNR